MATNGRVKIGGEWIEAAGRDRDMYWNIRLSSRTSFLCDSDGSRLFALLVTEGKKICIHCCQ